eukprot:12792417-Alexandrium_andersonii.AAC.1
MKPSNGTRSTCGGSWRVAPLRADRTNRPTEAGNWTGAVPDGVEAGNWTEGGRTNRPLQTDRTNCPWGQPGMVRPAAGTAGDFTHELAFSWAGGEPPADCRVPNGA